MKTIKMLGFLLVFCWQAQAQTQIVWKKCLGTAAFDLIGGVTKTKTNKLILAGEMNYKGKLIKMDMQGNTIWDKTYGGIGYDGFAKAIEMPNGDLIAYGNTGSSNMPNYVGGTDFWVMRTDSNGVLLWQSAYGEQYTDLASSIDFIDGKLLVSGNSDTYWMGGPPVGSPIERSLIVTINPNNGAAINTAFMYGATYSIKKTFNNTSNPSRYWWITWAQNMPEGLLDMDTTALSSTPPTSQWAYRRQSYISDAIYNNNGLDFIFVGITYDTLRCPSINPTYAGYQQTIFKTDTAMQVLKWRTCIPSLGGSILRYIVPSADGMYYAAGDGRMNEQWDNNFWLLKFDENGTIIWQDTYGGTKEEYLGGITLGQTPGEIILAGVTKSNDGDVAGSGFHGNYDGWVIKVKDQAMVSVTDAEKSGAWRVSPLAGSQYQVNFLGDLTKYPVRMVLTDALGQELRSYTAQSAQLVIDLSEYTQGIYFLRSTYGAEKLLR